MQLSGRTALVTGGALRIGRAIVGALAGRGARVAVHYGRSGADAMTLVAELRASGATTEAFAADLTDRIALGALADDVERRLGPVDVLVNNASVFRRTPLGNLDAAAWDENLAVNLTAPYLLSLRLGRAMQARGAGKIINIGDAGVTARPYRDYLPYCVAKSALETLTRGLAKALAPAVQVSCVAPGPMLPPRDATSADDEARIVARTPLGRFGGADEIAAAVLYLVEHDFVTGTTLVVDGGRSLV